MAKKLNHIRARCYFRIPIYEADFYFIWADSPKDAIRLLPKQLRNVEGVTRAIESCDGLYIANSPSYAIIVKYDTHDVIAHEVGHVCRKIMRDIGYHYRGDNDEPLAYLEGYLFKQIKNRIQRSLTAKKRKS